MPVVLVAVANAVVLLQARGETAGDVAALPHAQAALVLGAQVKPDGTPSDMLEDRIATAEELYRAGKVDKLLLSGDHGRVAYDEVGTMRRELLADGIPGRDLFTDHAGFDTWDSAQRARRVFARRLGDRRDAALPPAARAVRRPPRRPARRPASRPTGATTGASWGGCSSARRSRA